jgi:hypothetical protein
VSAGRRSALVLPPKWSDEALEEDRKLAVEQFRRARMEEPLDEYLRHFEDAQAMLEDLIEGTVDLSRLEEQAMELLSDPLFVNGVRYLAGPPISIDDLKTLADTNSIVPARLKRDTSLVERLISTIQMGLDRRRFPWVADGREPTQSEREAAIIATAALIATQRTQTARRKEGKDEQERLVHEALRTIGLQEVVLPGGVSPLTANPNPGTFSREVMVGSRKADVLVSLWDGRLVPIECKVSNSSTNSIKRINNDAAVKAVEWRREFGDERVVPSATLSGVYKLRNLTYAQERRLSIFWSHRLSDLTDWISRTRG